jgi:hypothetical protein
MTKGAATGNMPDALYMPAQTLRSWDGVELT